MNKLLAVMMVAVLPALAMGSDVESAAPVPAQKPVVFVIDLSAEQVQLLEKVHADYQARRFTVEEYNAQVDAVITPQTVAGI